MIIFIDFDPPVIVTKNVLMFNLFNVKYFQKSSLQFPRTQIDISRLLLLSNSQ